MTPSIRVKDFPNSLLMRPFRRALTFSSPNLGNYHIKRRQPYGQCQSIIFNKLSIELRLVIYKLILGPDSDDDSVRLLRLSRENTKIYTGNPTLTCIKFEEFKMCWVCDSYRYHYRQKHNITRDN